MATSIGSTLTVVLSALVLVSLVNLRQVHAQFVPICGVAGYNLGNLTARIWQFHILNSPGACLQPSANETVDSCRFFMAFCRNLDQVMFFNCSDASVCQESLPDTSSVFKLGAYEQNPFKVDTEYNSQGFIVDFPHGGTYQRVNGTACTLSVRLDFICKSDAFWEIPPLDTTPAEVPGPTPVFFNETSCQYEIMMNYAGACVYLTPGEVTGLSAGSILLIMFFVCLSVYCIFGAAFNYARGARGKEVVPNSGFWSNLPLWISDGIVFVLQGCKSSKKSYDDI